MSDQSPFDDAGMGNGTDASSSGSTGDGSTGSGSSGNDSVTEYSSQSWFQRIGGALVGLLVGLLFVPGSVVLLAWNEGRAVNTAIALAEGAGAVINVPFDRVDPANQGRLVHVAGPLKVAGSLTDPPYGVTALGAVKLVRHAEMFQWEQKEHDETRKTIGGGSETVKTYTYDRTWSPDIHDSSRFKAPGGHENPPPRVRSGTKLAALGTIGAYQLDKTLLDHLGPEERLPLTAAPPTGTLSDGGVYLGNDPLNPALGDTRIRYGVVHPEAASVVAQQSGSGFVPYVARNGRTVSMASAGEVPASAMFREAVETNILLTWVLRFVGVAVMLIGFVLILNPAAVVADVIPVLGSVVGFGVFLTGLLLTVVVAPIVIAVAWVAVRPIIGGSLLAGAAAAGIAVVLAMRRRRAARAMTPSFLPRRTV